MPSALYTVIFQGSWVQEESLVGTAQRSTSFHIESPLPVFQGMCRYQPPPTPQEAAIAVFVSLQLFQVKKE